MKPPVSPAGRPPAKPVDPQEKIRHLPPAVQDAFRRFQASGDLASLDVVILAILEDLSPKQADRPLAEMAGSTQLMNDLGFDSLAITEVVFFTEDLLGIRIANEEIMQVQTLDDLRGFVRSKVAARAAK